MHKNFRLLGLYIAVSVVLSGCGSSSASLTAADRAFANDQVYEGYPCGDECDNFQFGYEQALRDGVVDEDMCQYDTLSKEVGCKAYVIDYEYDNRSYDSMLDNL